MIQSLLKSVESVYYSINNQGQLLSIGKMTKSSPHMVSILLTNEVLKGWNETKSLNMS